MDVVKNKLKLKKIGWLILLCIGIILIIPTHSQALYLTNTKVKYSDSSDASIAKLKIYDTTAWYYTDYELYADEFLMLTDDPDGNLEAFCVENVGIVQTGEYELISVPVDLFTPAIVASNFLYGGTGWSKSLTQIVIWELVFDSGNIDIGDGNFKYIDGLSPAEVTTLNDILTHINDYDLLGPIGLAQSPRDIGFGSDGPSQNYLVSASVPDAGIMWLLGSAFIALGLFSRKKYRT